MDEAAERQIVDEFELVIKKHGVDSEEVRKYLDWVEFEERLLALCLQRKVEVETGRPRTYTAYGAMVGELHKLIT